MAKQRIVNTRFWDDNYILELKPHERLLFLWAITNPSTELCGAYEVALPKIVLQTGLKPQQILDAFAKFEKDEKMLYRDGWVVVRNFTRHQNGTSTNIKKGAERSLSYCPDWIKDRVLTGIQTHYKPSRVNTLPKPRPKPRPEPEPNGKKRGAAVAAPLTQIDDVVAEAVPVKAEKKPEQEAASAPVEIAKSLEPEAIALDESPAEDRRKSHPAIVAVHEVTGLYPPKEIWDDVIIDRMGVDVDVGRLKKAYVKWRAMGFNKTNYEGIIDWYLNGIPPATGGQNGITRQNTGTPGKHRNLAVHEEWEEFARSIE